MNPKLFIPLFLSLFFANYCFSQTYRGAEASQIINNTDLVKFKEYTKVPNYFRFSENTTQSEQETIEIIKSFIKNTNSDLQLKIAQKQGDGSYTLRYFQTVNGYPIEFSALHLQLKNNKITEINGEILDNPQIEPNFVISEETALQFALNYVNAKQYMWEEDDEYLPKGEKVIVPNRIDFENSDLKSAYKFNIFSKNPMNRQMIYVDAENGEIILDLPLIHFSKVAATAQTAYYGVRPIETTQSGAVYNLHDQTRGNGIHTFNCNNTATWPNNYYTNSTTTWNDTPYGTDAHFSTAATYDYFLQKHGYNSINNAGFALKSYVNFNLVAYGYSNNNNAFWNGQYMTYGNGTPPVTPLTTMDICGHEITHGLTTFSANLTYSYESGALSEGFSDIFGTAIEFFAYPEDANWTVGEKCNFIIRSMSNPKAYNQPDTYKGQYWYTGSGDNGGVHYNSGPLNYWFYLLCVGKSGINDLGNSYNVAAIGMSKAEKVAFKTLTHYLTPSSNYNDACFYGLQAAKDLYGECSEEVQAVGDAFYAIGVLTQPYSAQATADFKANSTQSCSTPLTVQFTNSSVNCDDFVWDFGDGSPTSTQKNPTHTYTQNGSFTVTLTGNSNGCGTDIKTKQNYINIVSNLSNHACKVYDTVAFELFIPEASENLRWYDTMQENLWETTPLFVGNPVQHPAIYDSITYYILDGFDDYEDKVGEKNLNSGGGYFTSTEVHYLVFDAEQSFILKSVLVKASTAGNRQIMLQNASGGNIWTITVNIPVGTSRITINKEIPAGMNLRLACQGTPNLFRSDISATLSYPYKIEGIVSIKYSSASSAPNSYYYYFYDWEIMIAGCHSEVATVTVTLSTKEPQPAPEAPELDSVTTTSITLVVVEGCEYRMDGGEWQTSPIFSELTPDSPYTFTQRFAETATHFASPESKAAIFKTNEEVGIEAITNYELRIYPNPTDGELRIEIAGQARNDVQSVEIFDVYGRNVGGKFPSNVLEGWQPQADGVVIDLTVLQSGIYFVKITTEQGEVVKKVVKL